MVLEKLKALEKELWLFKIEVWNELSKKQKLELIHTHMLILDKIEELKKQK